MRSGLTIVTVPAGGAYGYALIGWLRRDDGDEWEMTGARIIKRYGTARSIAELAAAGPIESTKLLPASKFPLYLHRLHMGRPEIVDPAVWTFEAAGEKSVPRPVGWEPKE